MSSWFALFAVGCCINLVTLVFPGFCLESLHDVAVCHQSAVVSKALPLVTACFRHELLCTCFATCMLSMIGFGWGFCRGPVKTPKRARIIGGRRMRQPPTGWRQRFHFHLCMTEIKSSVLNSHRGGALGSHLTQKKRLGNTLLEGLKEPVGKCSRKKSSPKPKRRRNRCQSQSQSQNQSQSQEAAETEGLTS